MTSESNIAPEESEDFKSIMLSSLLTSQGVTRGEFLLVVGVLETLDLVHEPLKNRDRLMSLAGQLPSEC